MIERREVAAGARPRTILFTAINYWPEPSGNAPYTTSLAQHLRAGGCDVTVVTGLPHYPAWTVDRAHPAGREDVCGVTVVRRPHFVPRRQSVAGRGLYEATFVASGAATRSLPRPDAIVGVVPSLSGAALARLFAARFHVPYGVVVQDLMGPAAAQSGIGGGGRVARAIARAEAWSLRRARVVAPVSDAFLPYLRSIGIAQNRLFLLPNWTVRRQVGGDRDATRTRFGWGPEQVVLHAGNMGLKQGLEQVLAAAGIAQARALDTRFVLLGDGNQREALQAAARELRNVSFLPSQPDDEYARALAAADVLLLSERASVTDMALPSKFTAYCAAGRPIVAAVRDDGATANEVRRSGGGVIVPTGNSEELLAALVRLRADTALCEGLAAAGLRYATTLDPAVGLARAEAFVERLLSRKLEAAA